MDPGPDLPRAERPAPANRPATAPDRVSTLLVDLEGTLVDATFLDAAAWFLAFDEVGRPQPLWEIHPRLGLGTDALVTELLGGPSEEVAAAHRRRVTDYLPSVRALPGACDLLDRGAAAGLRVCIVTTADGDDVDELLAPLGGAGAVDDVVHAGMLDTDTPSVDRFRVALDRSGAPRSETLAVGDTGWDVVSAAAAGIACIGLESGGTSRQALDEAGAVEVYRDARELVGHWSGDRPDRPRRAS